MTLHATLERPAERGLAPPGTPPWLAEALRVMERDAPGLSDPGGPLKLIGRINARAPFTLPWCGLFAAHCLRETVPGVELPALPARARPWRRWGEAVAPQLGALMVFWHYHPALPFGHAAFYWAEDERHYHVIGGNQRHRVCVLRYPRARLITARWPEGIARSGVARATSPDAAPPFR